MGRTVARALGVDETESLAQVAIAEGALTRHP